MNPYQFDVVCYVCGGQGIATYETAVSSWLGGVRHKDPQVCADNLARKAKRLKQKERELNE